MICPFCKKEIEEDSYYCDQCGKEIFICSLCGKPGKGNSCTEDGKKLISVKQSKGQVLTNGPESHVPNVQAHNQNTLQTTPYPEKISDSPLQLVNKNLNIVLNIKDKAIIAREVGEYAQFFQGKYMQVSSRQHLQFNYDDTEGWKIVDLASTNGTRISKNNIWENVPKLIPHAPVAVADNKYVLIANIEFEIVTQTSPNLTNTGTLRL